MLLSRWRIDRDFHILSSRGSGKPYISAGGLCAWRRWVCLSPCPVHFLLQVPFLALPQLTKTPCSRVQGVDLGENEPSASSPLPLALPDSQPACRAALLWPRQGSTRLEGGRCSAGPPENDYKTKVGGSGPKSVRSLVQ